jgi:sugar/nucleoside kinase (ribokinase family)
MNLEKITITGAGCAIADLIYNKINFESPEFKAFCSLIEGDGGLHPGKLVFTEELEKFSGNAYPNILNEIVGVRPPDTINVGGPSLVPMIHAAQLLDKENFEVKFYGMGGNDVFTNKIFEILKQTPLNIDHYKISENKATPTTDVFSDPTYDNGHGERTFVNNIGAAWDFTPEKIDETFFDGDIQCLGGTALVPYLHDHLSDLLKHSKQKECVTVVNTVFDFRNQKSNPDKPWPLVDNFSDNGLIDMLIMDCEEALKISNTTNIEAAANYFSNTGVASFIITNGAGELACWSNGELFEKTEILRFPVSNYIVNKLKTKPEERGDTTGCGDNFAGGIITSIALQLKDKPKGKFSLPEAVSWGVSSGGFCCFTVGGTYLENEEGEKHSKIQKIINHYIEQIS